jgi:hypothetical protein
MTVVPFQTILSTQSYSTSPSRSEMAFLITRFLPANGPSAKAPAPGWVRDKRKTSVHIVVNTGV